MKPRDHYLRLAEYAVTDAQRKTMQALSDHGSTNAAAKAMGLDRRGVARTLRRVEAQAAKRGYAPEHGLDQPAPQGYRIRGSSTLYDGNGKALLQWVKTTADQERQAEILEEALAAMRESIPLIEPIAPDNIHRNADLLNLHILTDYHMGMLAWGEECGEDWNIEIAEQLLYRWFDYAISRAPDAHTGVLAQMGDFLHFDGLLPVTPTSGHVLDADTRYARVVRVAIRSMRRIIESMLRKYHHVHIIVSDANHDPSGSIWLREMLAAFLSEDERVSVDQTPGTYNCYVWGDTSLFFHHGHKRGVGNVAETLAGTFRSEYGSTKHSYAHLGHRHHTESKETSIMTVHQHRTMAARDAHAAHGGWVSGRSAEVVTYSRQRGQVASMTVTPEMVGG
jgi:hypothetical protein